MNPHLRWLLLPVIVVVVASGTWAVQRMTADPGLVDPGGPVAISPAALSEQQMRDLLSHPAAPLTFTRFDDESEENGGPWPPSCIDRNGQELFSGKLTGPSFAPDYRAGNIGLSLLVKRVSPEHRTEVTRLLADPEQCEPAEYDPTAFDPAIPQTQHWETEFAADLGDAARLVRVIDFNPGDDAPLAVLGGAELTVVSGAWIISAVSHLYVPEPSSGPEGEFIPQPEWDPRDPDTVHAALVLPELVRTVLRPLDAAVGTTFAAPADSAKPCTAEALGEDDLRNGTGPAVMLALLVHDAACRDDADWLGWYRAPTYFVDSELRDGVDAHTTDGKHIPDLPALAEAIESGPVPSAGKRAVFAAGGWTFALDPRFRGLSGYLGHSTKCATAATGSDAICDAAQDRGVVGLNWEPPGMTSSCEVQPVDIRQRLYVTHRSAAVPDLVIRSTCRPVSTGNLPYDVTVLDGQRSTGDRTEVLSHLIGEERGYIVGPITTEDRTLTIPVDGSLVGPNNWELVTLGVEWRGSSYQVVSRKVG